MDSLTKVGCGPPALWGLCGGLTTHSRKRKSVTKPTRKRDKIRSDPKLDNYWQELTDIRFASWNVRSLYRPGALYQVTREMQRYKIGVAAIQEVRWPGEGECNIDNKATLFYSGADSGRHVNGTGFIVRKDLIGNVIRFDAVSDRIAVLRLKSKFSHISVISAYAPTEVSNDELKDQFYEDLESIYDRISTYDVKILLGDFNAKVGKEEAFCPTIGRYSKHDVSNDNGQRLISFAASKALVIKSTMYPHKEIHKGTWKSPDAKTINQIDHVLIDDRHKSTIEDVRTFRGADCDSDHYMIGIKLSVKIKVNKRKWTPDKDIIDVANLRDAPVRNRFQIELSNRFKDLEVEENVDNSWVTMKNIIKEVGLKVIGKKKRTKRRKWWTTECERLLEEKRKYRLLAEQDTRWEDKFTDAQIQSRKSIRKAKKGVLQDIISEMEMLIRSNASRKFYQEVRTIKKGYQPTTQFLLREDGTLVTDTAELKTMWHDYFQCLLNCPNSEQPVLNTQEHNESEVAPISFQEVENAVRRLKNNKAPGVDGIQAELWKYGGTAAHLRIFDLLTKVWVSEQQPEEWNVGVICPIHKKGCRKLCSNYRGIALLPTAYKILSYILLQRLEPYAEKLIGDYQCGFRRNRSTTDQIFILKQLMEKKWEYAQSMHSLFVDFSKAYDSIDRESLYSILTNFGIPEKLIKLIKVTTNKSRMCVRVDGELTESFQVSTGLKQGDALSPMLFNIALEHVIRTMSTTEEGVQLNGLHRVIAYADDLALLGQNKNQVERAARTLTAEAGKVGLRINKDKTEYLHMKRYKNTRQSREDLNVGDTCYKGVSKFRYLGCTITDTNTRQEEIDIRIHNALRCSAALHKVLVSKLLSRNTKFRIYKTVIRPIMMFGCEAWTLTLKEENKLLVAERRILRKILGPVKRDDGSWRVRKNLEIEDLFAAPNIIGVTKSQRLRWLGHVLRMGDDRATKLVYLGVPTGRRPVGRPRYRWSDVVEGDLRELQAANWRETAQDRSQWCSLVSEAMTHFGSLRQRSKVVKVR